jgi:hypothetical protein
VPVLVQAPERARDILVTGLGDDQRVRPAPFADVELHPQPLAAPAGRGEAAGSSVEHIW